jgi:hypothetical protein
MKRILLFFTVIIGISCTKQVIVEKEPERFIYTDQPLAEFFQNVPIGTVQNYWLDSAALKSVVVKQNGCQWNYDYASNNTQYWDCGDYRRILVYVYWGTKDGVIHLSKGKQYVWITDAAYSKAVERVFNGMPAVGEYCQTCMVTFGGQGVISWIK